jgi:PTH1 family peptidyl-tRNA hydrolase
MGTPDKLIVFLGNPGKNYERSRHNVGFMVADELADSLGIKINKLRFRSLSELCKLGRQESFF